MLRCFCLGLAWGWRTGHVRSLAFASTSSTNSFRKSGDKKGLVKGTWISTFLAREIVEFEKSKLDRLSVRFGVPYRFYVGTKTEFFDFIEQNRAFDSLGEDLGVFTDGDFRRRIAEDENLLARPLRQVMTRKPVCIREGALAVEALKVFDERDIDDLIVVNAKREPVGLVDSQDLPKLKLM